MNTVNLELVKTALEKVSGSQFEQFANAAFADLIGPDFIPLGGHHDWGADALLCTVTYSKRPHVFFQFSVEEDFRAKIAKTVARLREVKREVNTLYYATSRTIPRQDIVENELGEELNVIVRIRDGGYLTNQVNSSPSLLAAYHTYLVPVVAYLSDFHASPLLADDDANVNSAVYVFLRNELESREAGGYSEGLADGLIIWALRDTGATEGRFLTEADIVRQIEQDVPGVTAVLGQLIPARLKVLSRIPQPQQRPVRYHAYLMTQTGMEFESRKVIETDCKNRDVAKLAKLLEPYKKKSPLAWNDALMANLVYVRRQDGKETDDLSGYGLRTWWLTNEVAITDFTKNMVELERVSYLMRPDFLLNFLSMLPKKQQAKAIFETLFPSLLGVHLARDHSPAHVDRLHKYLQEVKAVDPARRRVLVSQLSDRLKADLRSVSWSGFFNSMNQGAKPGA